MKIAYIGNYAVTFTTESHIALSLETLGHEVIRLQENEYDADQIAEIAKDCDLLLWTRTWGVQGDAFKMLNEIKCPSVAYHLDLYAGLKRDGGIDHDPWWKCNYVFSADGGSPEFFKQHGVNHHYSPPGVFGRECYLARPEIAQDVIFTGSLNYHPEWQYRQQLIENLQQHYGSRFKLYQHSSGMRGDRLNRLYASAKVAVGDTLCLGFNHPNYFSDRLLETAGRGCAQVFPRIPGIENMFVEGAEILCYAYNNWDELYGKVDWLLTHDKEREEMRQRAFIRTISEHTYVHRMANMLNVVDGKPNLWETK